MKGQTCVRLHVAGFIDLCHDRRDIQESIPAFGSSLACYSLSLLAGRTDLYTTRPSAIQSLIGSESHVLTASRL